MVGIYIRLIPLQIENTEEHFNEIRKKDGWAEEMREKRNRRR
jgi:hypothetical protein